VAVVLVTLAPTPIPEKNIRSNIWCGLLPGIYGSYLLFLLIARHESQAILATFLTTRM
jgi:hypothetical protein